MRKRCSTDPPRNPRRALTVVEVSVSVFLVGVALLLALPVLALNRNAERDAWNALVHRNDLENLAERILDAASRGTPPENLRTLLPEPWTIEIETVADPDPDPGNAPPAIRLRIRNPDSPAEPLVLLLADPTPEARR